MRTEGGVGVGNLTSLVSSDDCTDKSSADPLMPHKFRFSPIQNVAGQARCELSKS
jgi:hypothetical protein